MTAPFATLHVGLPTPMDERGQIDEAALDLLVDYLLQRSIDGIALLSEAAEDGVLQPDERTSLVERVLGRVDGKMPTIVFITAASTRAAVDLARVSESKGAAAVVVAPMATPGLGYRALYRHVDRVGRAVQIPVYLGIRPYGALDVLAEEEINTIGDHEKVKGVFVPQSPSAQIESWARRMKDRGPVLTGCAFTFPSAARAGASGVVCGLSMLGTEQAVQIMNAVRGADLAQIKTMSKRTKPAVDMLGPPKSLEELDGAKRLAARIAARPLVGPMASLVPFAYVKEGLRLQGHKIRSFVRPPHEQVSPEMSDKLKAVLKSSGLIS